MRIVAGVLVAALFGGGSLVGGGLLAPAAASESGPGTVKFVPEMSPLRPKALKVDVRKHTLAIVPLYASKEPDLAALRSMGAATKAFWEREIPGLRVDVRYLKASRYSGSCDRTVNGAWTKARSVAKLDPYRLGNHVVAYAPECNMNGLGSLRPGSGLIYIGMPDSDGSMLAHEFGHNLGLRHANVLQCTSKGAKVSLSKTCTEFEYGDWTSVMGNGPLGPTVRVGSEGQTLIIGRTTTLAAGKPAATKLSTTAKGGQVATLRTRFGVVNFVASPYGAGQGSGVLLAEVVTKRGSGLLQFPEVDTRTGVGLRVGDVWDVPGTSVRVIVTAAANNEVGFLTIPRPKQATAPPAPVIFPPADGQYPADIPWTLSWTAGGDPAAFLIKAGDQVVTRAPGDARSVEMPTGLAPTDSAGDIDVTTHRVIAVGRDGGRTESSPVVLTPVAAVVSLSASVDEWSVVTSPFTLAWSILPASYQGAVDHWLVRHGDQEMTFPADQSAVTVDPSLSGDAEFGDVAVVAIGRDGKAIARNSFAYEKALG